MRKTQTSYSTHGKRLLRHRNKPLNNKLIHPNSGKIHVYSKMSILLNLFKKNNFKKFCGFLKSIDGYFFYSSILHGITVGSIIETSYSPYKFVNFKTPGSIILLKHLPIGSLISNIVVKNKITYCTAAGTYAKNLYNDKEKNLSVIYLPTGLKKKISLESMISLGRNSNIFSNEVWKSSYGTNYYIGKKPKVRGVAMNPVDHPHGGRTKSNKPEVSLWGWVTKRSH